MQSLSVKHGEKENKDVLEVILQVEGLNAYFDHATRLGRNSKCPRVASLGY